MRQPAATQARPCGSVRRPPRTRRTVAGRGSPSRDGRRGGSGALTKDGSDPTQPLTRADLEPQPFLTVPFGGRLPGSTVSHSGTLPQKSGKHLILGVWTISDTGNAFYACSDVQF